MSETKNVTKLTAVKNEVKKSKSGSKVDVVATGIVTGVGASIIMLAGQGIVKALVRRPLVMFGMGIATGYFSYKHRKQIISVSDKVAEQGKDFVLRQQESFKEWIEDHSDKK